MNSTPSAAKIVGIGPERDRGAGLAAPPGRVADDQHLALRDAALGVVLAVVLAVAVDLDDEALGQRVDDRHTHAVEPAGDLVAVAAELAAGVQHGEHDLGRALALVLACRERVDRDAATVVVDLAAAVGEQRDADARAVAGHRLVDRVVDDLPDQVVQPREPGRADVHARPFADRIEALQDLDGVGVVASRSSSPDRGSLASDGSAAGRRFPELRSCRWTLVPRVVLAFDCLATPAPCTGSLSGRGVRSSGDTTAEALIERCRWHRVASGIHPTSGVSQSRGAPARRRGNLDAGARPPERRRNRHVSPGQRRLTRASSRRHGPRRARRRRRRPRGAGE